MAVNVFKNVLAGAGTVLVLDPGPVPTVSETRQKLRAKRFARKHHSKVVTVKPLKSPLQFAEGGYAERVASETVAGVEQMLDVHPKRTTLRTKVGKLRLVVFRPKTRSDQATSG